MKTLILFFVVSFSLVSCIDVYDDVAYDSRNRVVGSYDVEEYSTTYHEYVYYTVYVSNSSRRNEVTIDNFYGENFSVYAYINGDYVTIPFQIVDGFEVEGSGEYYRGELHLTYTVRDRYSSSRANYCETVAFKR